MVAVLLQWEPNQEPGTLPRVDVEFTHDPAEFNTVLERRVVFDDMDSALAFAWRYRPEHVSPVN